VALAGAVPALAACTSAAPTTAATHAADPVCAQVMLATPDSLGDGLDRRQTTAQATTAWGPDPAITLTCGVEPPGPTTDRCETVTSSDGTAIDWLVVEGELAADGTSDWWFTTYGRVPAVQVHVPGAVAATRSTSFLDALGPAVAHTARERGCV
jgi:hypothetical protein